MCVVFMVFNEIILCDCVKQTYVRIRNVPFASRILISETILSCFSPHCGYLKIDKNLSSECSMRINIKVQCIEHTPFYNNNK